MRRSESIDSLVFSPEGSNKLSRTQTSNIGGFIIFGIAGNDTINAVLFSDNKLICELENYKRILIKRMPFQKYIQNNICVNQNFHFKYFFSRSSRISSRLISPRLAAIPRSRSARGVGLSEMGVTDSLVLACEDPSVLPRTGVTLSSTSAEPAGISFGARNSKRTRRSAGISIVCVIVMN